MTDANLPDLNGLQRAADEVMSELKRLTPRVAAARRAYFGQGRSEAARVELQAIEQRGTELHAQLADIAKQLQDAIGLSDADAEALERRVRPGDQMERVHRGQLTADKIEPSASVPKLLEASFDKLLALVDPRQLKAYEALPAHRLIDPDHDVPLSLVRGIRPESESPRIHRFAQALHVTRDFVSEHLLYDHFAGALLVPQMARLSDRLPLLDGVPGASKRLRSLWRGSSHEVDPTLFELFVAAGCAAMGRSVEFVDATQAKSPDLMCHDPYPMVIECKRKRSLSDYEITEEQCMRGIFLRLEAAARSAGMWGIFSVELTVEASTVPPDELVTCLIRQRYAGGYGKRVTYDWGTVAWTEMPRTNPLPRTSRLYSPAMLQAAFGWNSDLAEFDGLICRISNSREPTLDSVDEAVALLWTNVSAQAVKKRSWGPTGAVNEALAQVPAGDFGIVYIAVQEGAREEMADSRTFGFAERLREMSHRNDIRVPLCKLVRLYPRALGEGAPDLIESTVNFVADYGDDVLPTLFPSAVFTKP